MVKTDIEALTKRIEKLEAQVGKHGGGDPLVGHLVEYSNDLGNSLAGNERILPLMKRLDELETYLDPLFGEKEACSLGVKMSLGIRTFYSLTLFDRMNYIFRNVMIDLSSSMKFNFLLRGWNHFIYFPYSFLTNFYSAVENQFEAVRENQESLGEDTRIWNIDNPKLTFLINN